LFDRKGNKIYLTEAGRVTYKYLKEIQQDYHELTFELGRLNATFKGRLTIGASSTISQYLIPAVISAFHTRYPQIDINLISGNSFQMEQKLLNNEVDIALVENASSLSNVKYTDFLPDEIIAVTGINSSFARQDQISLPDLKEAPVVLREQGSGTLEVIENALSKHGVSIDEMNVVIHLGSTEAIKNFMDNFNGIALVSERAVTKEVLFKTIQKLPVAKLAINRQFRIAQLHGRELELPKLFIDFLSCYNF
jgi:DNA-binding transcriptional LysR family regulator